MVIVVDSERKGWGGFTRVSIPDGPSVYVEGFDREDSYKRGLVFKHIYERFDGCEVLERGAIPTDVACQGKAAIASYLYSAHQKPIEDIADQLEVSPGTIEQYISDFRHGRR